MFDWGEFSDTLSVLAASAPDTPSAPTTEIESLTGDVKISWTAPYSSITIDKYLIEIGENGYATYTEDATNCDGSDATVIGNLYCVIPMSTLTLPSYSLSFQDVVKAKVSAYNSVSWSSQSSENSAGAQIRRVPDQITDLAVVSASDTSIEVSWGALVASANGDSDVTAYELYWDNAGGTVNTQLIKDLITSYTVTGITGGSTYKFQVRAYNVYGAAASFSNEVSASAVDTPDKMAIPTVTLNAQDIEIHFDTPAPHSAAIDQIEF
mmetsp:Transcript_9438/g.8956  ORF Transcript_9438/g.8956 Transcript_9438/m.8956 type:complete len:266 (+) Transcript_9438:2179-2976(+)